jgi:origin recognition complex subunit 6
MGNQAIEQALAQLLPTHDDDLPPELVNLSITLLAQSRSYASSLKPEEEIARPYVCAEISCNRLVGPR